MRIVPFQLIVLACASAAAAQTPYPLHFGEIAAERVVVPGKPHTYTVSFGAQQFVSGVADQRTVDVVVRVLDPTGSELGRWA